MSTPSVGLVDWMQDASGYAEFTFRTIGRASRNHVWRLESSLLGLADCIGKGTMYLNVSWTTHFGIESALPNAIGLPEMNEGGRLCRFSCHAHWRGLAPSGGQITV